MCMSQRRTNIEIDVEKLDQAKKISGMTTTKEIVDFALDRLIRSSRSLKELIKLKGKVSFDSKYNYKGGR